MKKFYFLLVFVFAGFLGFGQDVLYSQDFETDQDGYTHAPSQTPSTDPGDQYFYRAEPSNGDIYELVSDGPYSNVTNSWLFVGSNPNTINTNSPGELLFASIDISGYSDFELYADFGAVPSDWDSADDLYVEYQIDAGSWNTLYSFEAGGDGTNEPIALSGNATGGINTANGTTLTYSLTTIATDNFSGTGSSMNIKIVCDADANYEAFGVDNIILKGTAAGPAITLSTTSISGFEYTVSHGPSDEQSFTVAGSNLTANISITPPTNYEISTGTGGSFSAINPITLTQSGGTVSSTPIYVRLKDGLAVGDYNSEDITATSTDATDKTVTCNGSVTSPNVPGSFGSSTISSTQIDLTFTTNSDGDNIIIIYDLDNTFTAPSGVAPAVGATFAGGEVVYKGTSSPVNHTGLSSGTQYYYKAYSYVGSDYSSGYNTNATTFLVQPTNHVTGFSVALGSPSTSVIAISWTDAIDGTLPENYLIKGSTTSYGDIASPVDGTPEADGGLVLNVANGVGSAEFTGLSENTTYYFKIYPYTNSGLNIDYKTDGTVPSGTATTDEISEGLQLNAVNTVYTIDFDNTVTNVNNSQFNGSGITSSPSSGQLNSNAWEVIGLSDGDLEFGGNKTTGDFARGISSGGVTSGGIYAFEVSPSNYGFGVQITSSDWNPGYVTLKVQNSTGISLTSLDIKYTLYILNNEGRSTLFYFDYSSDNVTYTDILDLDYSTVTSADGSPTWKAYTFVTKITGINVSDGDFFYISWNGEDNGGSGSRDEFAIDDISVAGNFTSPFDVAGTIEDLVISSAGSAQIASTDDLTINGDLNNKGTFTIKSDVSSTGSLILGGSLIGSGTNTVERYISPISGNNGWHFLSSPVSAMDISGSDFIAGTYDLYRWGESTVADEKWLNYEGGSFGHSQFEVGIGYLFAESAGGVFEFTGDLNDNANYPKTLTNTVDEGDGWNLVGNPYPSGLNWNTISKETGKISGSYYVVDPSNSTYLSSNGTDGDFTDGYIPPHQGFFVQVTEEVDITMQKSDQVHGADNYEKSDNQYREALTVELNGLNSSNRTYFSFRDDATKDFDFSVDAEKLYGWATIAQVYSELEGTQYAINCLPHSEETITVPLGISLQADEELSLNFSGMETFFNTVKIELEDKQTGLTQNIKENPVYTFQATTEDNPNRFLLHFNGVTGVEDAMETQNIQVYSVDHSIYVSSLESLDAQILVYNINGQVLYQDRMNAETFKKINLKASSGVYLVSIISEETSSTQKVYVK